MEQNVALYYIGFSLFDVPINKSLDGVYILSIVLYIVGTLINIGGEILRDKWKKNLSNKGKICYKGFLKYSRHIKGIK
ncbi:DUF1295 domain-containing protein [Algoriphagus sp. C2-6-M1]|uniref:DUF1295 domain-containing protein n=1 Tax=Algoriphagus persicinus TaxID=3108754 RepID=UPI003A5D1C11